MCLIPALIAGVIADEHQRKTLHYLLASQLSSAEIVLGKLGARLVHVGSFIALGIPVVCLLALYGGLNPENVFYVYLGTLMTVIFTSGLSILVSIMAQRPRDAILAAYSLEALWLLAPILIHPFSRDLGGSLWWVRPVNDWVLLTNPAFVWEHATHQTNVFTTAGLRSRLVPGPVHADVLLDGRAPGGFGALVRLTCHTRSATDARHLLAWCPAADGLVVVGGRADPNDHAYQSRDLAHSEPAADFTARSSALRRRSDGLERAAHVERRRPALAGEPADGALLQRALGLLPA